MKRRDARELAFALLFEQSFTNAPMESIISTAEKYRDVKLDEFARRLCLQSGENREAIDEKISRHATHWNIGRLPRVTLTLLRICIAEMDFMEDVPVSVSINEAVELCKLYATEEDAAFLNGVLGAYAKGEKSKVDLPGSGPLVLPGDEVTFSETQGELNEM